MCKSEPPTNPLLDDIEEILLTEEQIQARVRELAAEISRDYAGKTILLVMILRGAAVFLADLSRHLTVQVALDFILTSRTGSPDSGFKIIKDLDTTVDGQHVLIIEDIIEHGASVDFLVRHLANHGAASVRICTIFDKPYRRQVPIDADYQGFVIPDRFVVGYGLDYRQIYRNLPFLATLKPGITGQSPPQPD